ncbi:MAG: acetyl-CoA decarbonylase/synthase complex subunit gamma [Candidatus Omnitrophica bacterium]|nr:acetyl-CoA decarbonylase/synthase complex subunit gamma [Candidatus Omnitrophota bacterium]
MALSGLDIYKLLPKTNCKECGFSTCLAFAMQLAKKAVSIEKCPTVGADAKSVLEASSLPPIKKITIGSGEHALEIGNESVMFRHEEKFHRPCGIGFIIDDSLTDAQIRASVEHINALSFERVGQTLSVNLIAIQNTKDTQRFVEAVTLVSKTSLLGLVLMSDSIEALRQALRVVGTKKPLLYRATKANRQAMGALAKEFQVPLVVSEANIDELQEATKELAALGATDLVLHTVKKPLAETIWDVTQMRRQSLKKNNRALGYPALMIAENRDPLDEAIEAGAYIAKYAGIVLIRGTASWEVLSLLTLRQNIYTDPQKPLQIEPKLYSIGQVSKASPVLVTTNFSLSYYTVLGEVEASKVPSYIVSVDTEGMSVLTAWAAEKFTPDKITDTLLKCNVSEAVAHKRLVIPGYVAVMSGELEEKSGWNIVVGPKEAAGIPSFLKNL